ncbi:MAG: transcription elongation factor GreA [Deltaproteobacteria bacterium]|nr:transcription elongation factor GreA [Deltaproteobacteria bacterium]
MSSQKVPMTPAGERMLREELKRLREVERPRNVKDIEEARAQGDLSENAEYHAAKEKQGFIAGQMADIEDKLSRAQVIDPARLSGERVAFGATVALVNSASGEEVTYQIVGEHEASLERGTISITSPMARALLGHEADEEVRVQTPAGVRVYEIVSVEFK